MRHAPLPHQRAVKLPGGGAGVVLSCEGRHAVMRATPISGLLSPLPNMAAALPSPWQRRRRGGRHNACPMNDNVQLAIKVIDTSQGRRKLKNEEKKEKTNRKE